MKYLFLMAFIMSSAYGKTIYSNFSNCERQGLEYRQTSFVDLGCRDFAVKNADERQIKNGTTVSVLGYKSFVFIDYQIKNKVKNFYIVGDRTLLSNVQAVEMSKDEKTIYVLDENQLLIYESLSNGNVSPKQVIAINEGFCSNIKIGDQNSFYIQCNEKIVQGKLLGDSRMKIASKKPKPTSSLKVHNNIDLKVYDGKLLMLDKVDKKISLFSNNIKDPKEWSIDLIKHGVSRDPASIEVKENIINIKDVDGKNHTFE